MPPGKPIRYGASAAKNTAWLGEPITYRPGASYFENTPQNGSTTAFKLCRSTSPQASETGRASNRPICNVSFSNNVLRLTATAQSQLLTTERKLPSDWCTQPLKRSRCAFNRNWISPGFKDGLWFRNIRTGYRERTALRRSSRYRGKKRTRRGQAISIANDPISDKSPSGLMLRYGLMDWKKFYDPGACIERQSGRSATGGCSGGGRCRL